MNAQNSEPRTDQESLGARILYCRKRAKMTQRDLAQIVGTGHAAVGHWEKGRNTPGLDVIRNLAEIFDVPMLWLLEGGGDTPAVKPPRAQLRQAKRETGPGIMNSWEQSISKMTPLQLATADAIIRALANSSVPDNRCLELLSEFQSSDALRKDAV